MKDLKVDRIRPQTFRHNANFKFTNTNHFLGAKKRSNVIIFVVDFVALAGFMSFT